MACPQNNIFFIQKNSWLIHWIENFYISIIESNYLMNLYKYKKIFELLFIFADLAKSNIFLEKEKLTNKLLSLEKKWRGNVLSIKNIEKELKRNLFKLKEDKIEYKILILCSEINLLISNKNLEHLKENFFNYKNNITEKLLTNNMTKFEKKIAVKNLENTLYLCNHHNK